MKLTLFGSALIMAVVSLAAPAHAKVEEIRLGYVQNMQLDHGDLVPDGKEGQNAEIELVSSAPDFFHFLGHPRPYLVGSFNTSDDGVNFGGFGLLWRWEFADGWAFEPGFGYIIHDGEKDNPFANDTPEAAAFSREHQLLGSRDLFRTTFGLEREFGPHWGAQIYYEHMSHGQILDQGRNQGLDYVGLRILRRFSADPAN